MKKIILVIILSLLGAMVLIGCKNENKTNYSYITYTKEEIMNIFLENTDLFEKVVEIVSTNDEFYNTMHVVDYDDAFLMDPYPESLKYFNDEDKQVLIEFFEFGPSAVTFDDSKNFVKFRFINEEKNGVIVFLRWLRYTDDENNSYIKEYKSYLHDSLHFSVEDISKEWIFYYTENTN